MIDLPDDDDGDDDDGGELRASKLQSLVHNNCEEGLPQLCSGVFGPLHSMIYRARGLCDFCGHTEVH